MIFSGVQELIRYCDLESRHSIYTLSHAHKPQLKMAESTEAEQSDTTEKTLIKKRLPTKVNY